MKTLHGHVPVTPPGLQARGLLNPTNQLRLAIGLDLRDPAGLESFLNQVYDPASPGFHSYLTPEAFTERFGPTAEDYQKVIQFAGKHGLTVTATHGNRLLLDVVGPVKAVEGAFNVTLRVYRHPKEARDFFAPDAEPSVDSQLAIADISGLSDYSLPRPLSHPMSAAAGSTGATPMSGSSPNGSYMGKDFRAAYLPGVALDGAGQQVGLLQFDGFYASDISAYASAAGLPNVPIQTVLVDGYNGVPTTGPNSGNSEVSLDIEMAMSMAPGLSGIVVFEAGPNGIPNDLLNRMAASNQVKQLSCSWGWGGGPRTTTDNIFKQMAAQGQSFFSASGDSDAFTSGAQSSNGVDNPSVANTPSSCPYITTVGGTTLTTAGPGGAWVSETVWNWGSSGGSYVGSSGGISSYYTIPDWQTGISMSANGGSTSQRNIPDVALTADNVYVISGNGARSSLGGTSCAAPLWAGLAALINQQAATTGKPALGFLNPALYALGKSPGYAAGFHDVTTGNNVSGSSPHLFYATAGYDLCTGWGTPAGQALIDALAGAANALAIQPTAFTANGPTGGPFQPASQSLTLTNTGSSALNWSIKGIPGWLTLSPTTGTLSAHGSARLALGIAPAATTLAQGVYNSVLVATNSGGGTLDFSATLNVGQSLVQNGGFETGDFNGWNLVGDTVIGSTIYNQIQSRSSQYPVVHSGTYGAFLGDTQLASISQTLPTLPGAYYVVSLWLENPASGAVQHFKVNWNTNATVNTLYDLPNPPSFPWTNLQFLVRATGSTATLQLQAENDPSYFSLDDVSVVPVPPPAPGNLALSGNDVQLSWATVSGVSYQVQYKTDLSQNDWLNLGAPFVATGPSTTVTDTGALTQSRERYYRLILAP